MSSQPKNTRSTDRLPFECEITEAVRDIGAHQREVTGDRGLHHVIAVPEAAHFLALA